MPVALRDDCHTICGLVTRMLRHVEPLRHPQFDICKQRYVPTVQGRWVGPTGRESCFQHRGRVGVLAVALLAPATIVRLARDAVAVAGRPV
jgi:hypothetical protein